MYVQYGFLYLYWQAKLTLCFHTYPQKLHIICDHWDRLKNSSEDWADFWTVPTLKVGNHVATIVEILYLVWKIERKQRKSSLTINDDIYWPFSLLFILRSYIWIFGISSPPPSFSLPVHLFVSDCKNSLSACICTVLKYTRARELFLNNVSGCPSFYYFLQVSTIV